MVRLMETIGLAGILCISWLAFKDRLTSLQLILFVAIVAMYAFLRFCMMWRWYRAASRSAGIALQFEKALVPTSYILAVMLWLFVVSGNSIVLAIAAFLVAVVAHVNVILLYLHFKDRDRTPVNSYGMTH